MCVGGGGGVVKGHLSMKITKKVSVFEKDWEVTGG